MFQSSDILVIPYSLNKDDNGVEWFVLVRNRLIFHSNDIYSFQI